MKNSFLHVRYDFALNVVNKTDYIRYGSPEKNALHCIHQKNIIFTMLTTRK
jgi:hypothetical protein